MAKLNKSIIGATKHMDSILQAMDSCENDFGDLGLSQADREGYLRVLEQCRAFIQIHKSLASATVAFKEFNDADADQFVDLVGASTDVDTPYFGI